MYRYGECSRSCGGGVKKSIRLCNRPEPAHGGRYCTGRRERYRSCGTRECLVGNQVFRDDQCALYNNNNFNILGLPEDVKWVPKYGVLGPEEQCKLYCRVLGTGAYYPLKEKVVDGTPCGPDTFDMCVNGICRQAGCNHILGSTMKLDMCGKCGGDNSTCVPIKGNYNNLTYGYSRVVRIPAGSSNLDIRQVSEKNSTIKDDSDIFDMLCLALLVEDTGEYILNGHYVVSISYKSFLFGETKFEYTGSHMVVERINSSSRPLKKDLTLQVLSVGKLHPPNITFHYTVERGKQYKWELKDKWTTCDKACYGKKWQVQQCLTVDKGQVVPDEHCAGLRPLASAESCNTHCIIKWRTWPLTECSVRCGHGTLTQGIQCVQDLFDSNNDNMVRNSSCAHLPKPPQVVDCKVSCNGTHWVYGDWTQCSKSCGVGPWRTVADTSCSAIERPQHQIKCDLPQCYPTFTDISKQYEWRADEWSRCSKTCGRGERFRQVVCIEVSLQHRSDWKIHKRWHPYGKRDRVKLVSRSDVIVPNSECDENRKPKSIRGCHMMMHCPHSWVEGEWSE
ncbi:hypothetical protein L9F63_022515, partial [Diploptera punctata]